MARFLRDRYFWYLAALAIVLGSIYGGDIVFPGWMPSREEWHLTYMALGHLVFLIGVVIAAWRFGVKGGLVASAALGLVLLPHSITMATGLGMVDELMETVIFIAAGVTFSWLVDGRKQTEAALRESEERYRNILDSMLEGCQLIDYDWRYVYVNNATVKHAQRAKEELLGHSMMEMYPGIENTEMFAQLRRCMEERIPHHMETEFTFPDGSKGWFELSIQPVPEGIFILSVDITERKQMQEQLMVTDRLASIGELASGIAHELNNPLTSVIGFSQLLMEKDVADDVREDVKIICSEAQRTAEIVKGLLTFARKHAPVTQLVNINSIIEKVMELRAYEQKVSNIQVNTRFASDLPEIMVDYFQLQQVFLNIIINAEYFMTEAHNKGTMTITTERTGDVIRISFADDGPGISKDNIGHLFDPFFTTKEVGKGTGLGLSICHGIITEHGGRIYAESESGKGATFIVELPITLDKRGAVK